MDSARGLKKVIESVCAAKAPCTLAMPSQSLLLQGSFVGTVGNGIIFDIHRLPPGPVLGAPGIVTVTFNHAEGTTAFVTRILAYHESTGGAEKGHAHANGVSGIVDGGARMRVAWPNSASHYSCRMAFRVPVRDAKLEAVLVGRGGVTTPAKVIDLSASGAKIARRRSLPPLPAGSELTLRFRLGDHEVTLDAEIRRHDDSSYGVFFPSVLKEGHICPERALEQIVRELERAWLRRRLAG